jgi:hypothetical protein
MFSQHMFPDYGHLSILPISTDALLQSSRHKATDPPPLHSLLPLRFPLEAVLIAVFE